MLIRVLGCSGAIAAGNRTTSFLLDDDVLVDAGTGVGDLTLDELVRIDDILVSHSHLDHIVSIALLADSTLRRRRAAGRGPIRVHALAPTLAALRAHVFNGVVWPDFTRLPSVEQPALELRADRARPAHRARRSDDRGARGRAHRAGLRLRDRV